MKLEQTLGVPHGALELELCPRAPFNNLAPLKTAPPPLKIWANFSSGALALWSQLIETNIFFGQLVGGGAGPAPPPS